MHLSRPRSTAPRRWQQQMSWPLRAVLMVSVASVGFVAPAEAATLQPEGVTVAAEQVIDGSAATASFAPATSLRTLTDLRLTLDLQKLLGWAGAIVRVQPQLYTGRDGSADAFILQNISSIEARHYHTMGELWIEQRLLDNRLRLKLGRIDFNNEFAVARHGLAFLNGAMGFSPSIAGGPSYPLSTTGLNAFAALSDRSTLALGYFDGRDGAPAPSGGHSRFQIAELGHRWDVQGRRPGRVGVGVWRHTGLFAERSPTVSAPPDSMGTYGWYATVDQQLWQGAARGIRAPARLSAFLQIGESDARVRSVHAHRGGGLTLAGLSARRARDLIGAGFTRARFEDGRESIIEVLYELALVQRLTVVLDLQRVRRWDAQRGSRIGHVSTLRTILRF